MVTVEPVGAYKPVAAVYDHAMRAVGAAVPGDIAFVSSNRWDVAGAATFGFRTFWINRSGMPDEYPGRDPEAVLTDLSGLATALGA